ncbi:uncharacterized protein LOC143028005 [Oratosquilla oratoria]|uniref:uncharacterized protein LOC143028005 n=1 Tax=Oratosquilla oratoria TaxID=337810 RepID=UPI003F7696B1
MDWKTTVRTFVYVIVFTYYQISQVIWGHNRSGRAGRVGACLHKLEVSKQNIPQLDNDDADDDHGDKDDGGGDNDDDGTGDGVCTPSQSLKGQVCSNQFNTMQHVQFELVAFNKIYLAACRPTCQEKMKFKEYRSNCPVGPEVATAPQSQQQQQQRKRQQHCTFCKNHELRVPTKGHGKQCAFRLSCDCDLCELTRKSQMCMKHQQRVWRHLKGQVADVGGGGEPDGGGGGGGGLGGGGGGGGAGGVPHGSSSVCGSLTTSCGTEGDVGGICGNGVASTAGPAAVRHKRQVCDLCRNHNEEVSKKGHKGKCRYEKCTCSLCVFTKKRQSVMKFTQRVRRRQNTDLVAGPPPPPAPPLPTHGEVAGKPHQPPPPAATLPPASEDSCGEVSTVVVSDSEGEDVVPSASGTITTGETTLDSTRRSSSIGSSFDPRLPSPPPSVGTTEAAPPHQSTVIAPLSPVGEACSVDINICNKQETHELPCGVTPMDEDPPGRTPPNIKPRIACCPDMAHCKGDCACEVPSPVALGAPVPGHRPVPRRSDPLVSGTDLFEQSRDGVVFDKLKYLFSNSKNNPSAALKPECLYSVPPHTGEPLLHYGGATGSSGLVPAPANTGLMLGKIPRTHGSTGEALPEFYQQVAVDPDSPLLLGHLPPLGAFYPAPPPLGCGPLGSFLPSSALAGAAPSSSLPCNPSSTSRGAILLRPQPHHYGAPFIPTPSPACSLLRARAGPSVASSHGFAPDQSMDGVGRPGLTHTLTTFSYAASMFFQQCLGNYPNSGHLLE